MEVAKNKNVNPTAGTGDWEVGIKKDVASLQGVCERDRIGVDGRDEVGAWRQILPLANC